MGCDGCVEKAKKATDEFTWTSHRVELPLPVVDWQRIETQNAVRAARCQPGGLNVSGLWHNNFERF
jgi:hypothetical protein